MLAATQFFVVAILLSQFHYVQSQFTIYSTSPGLAVLNCDTAAAAFVSNVCESLGLEESDMCATIGGRYHFFMDRGACGGIAQALSQVSIEANANNSQISCYDHVLLGRDGSLLVPTITTEAVLNSTEISLRNAANGGVTDFDSIICEATTTRSPSTTHPTGSPVTVSPTVPPTVSSRPTVSPSPLPRCHGEADSAVCNSLSRDACFAGSQETQDEIQRICKILCDVCPDTAPPTASTAAPTRSPTGICAGEKEPGDESFDPSFCRTFSPENCSDPGNLGADLRSVCRVLCQTCPTVAPTAAPSIAPTTKFPTRSPTTPFPTYSPTAIGTDDLISSVRYYLALGGQPSIGQEYPQWSTDGLTFCSSTETVGDCMASTQACQNRAETVQRDAPQLWVANGEVICRQLCQFTCANATISPTSSFPTSSPTFNPTASPTSLPTQLPTQSASPSASPTASPSARPGSFGCTQVGDSGSQFHLTTTSAGTVCEDHVRYVQEAVQTCTGQSISLSCTLYPNTAIVVLSRNLSGCGAEPVNDIIGRVGYLQEGTAHVGCDTNGFFTAPSTDCPRVASILNDVVDLVTGDVLENCNFTSPSTTVTSTATSSASTTQSSTQSSTVSTTVTSTILSTVTSTASSSATTSVTSTPSTTASSSATSSQSSTASTSASSTVTSTVTTGFYGRVECTSANRDTVFATGIGGDTNGNLYCGGGGNDTASLLTRALQDCSGDRTLIITCKVAITDSGRVELLAAETGNSCSNIVAGLSAGQNAVLVSHTGDLLEPTLCGTLGTLTSQNSTSCRNTAAAINAVVEFVESEGSGRLRCSDIQTQGALPTTTVTSTVTTTPVAEQLECSPVNGINYVHVSEAYSDRCSSQAAALNSMIESCTGETGNVACLETRRFDNNRDFFTFTGGSGVACDRSVSALNRIIGVHGFSPNGTLLCDATNTIRSNNGSSCTYDVGILNEAIEAVIRDRFEDCGLRTSPSTTVTSTQSSSASTSATSSATTSQSSTASTTISSSASTSATSTASTSQTSTISSTATTSASTSATSSATTSQSSTATTTATTSVHYDGRIQCTETRGGDLVYEVRRGACAVSITELNALLRQCGLQNTNNLLQCVTLVSSNENRSTIEAFAVDPSGCSTTAAQLNAMIENVGFMDWLAGGVTCTLQGYLRHSESQATPCTYTRNTLVEILESNEENPWNGCPIRASASSTATSTVTTSVSSTASSSQSTTITSSATTSASSTASTSATTSATTSVTTSASSSATTSATSTASTSETTSATTSLSSTVTSSVTTTVTTALVGRSFCDSSGVTSIQAPQTLVIGGQSIDACEDQANQLNAIINGCVGSDEQVFVVCDVFNASVPNALRMHPNIVDPSPALVHINAVLRDTDTNGICPQSNQCQLELLDNAYFVAGNALVSCQTAIRLFNHAVTAQVSGLVNDCEYSTASTTGSSTPTSSESSTATTTATTEEFSTVTSTVTSTATSSATTSASSTGSSTQSSTATTTVTTIFDASLDYSCESTGSVLISLLTLSRHGVHCDRHVDTLNALLAWCNPNDPDDPINDDSALQITLGTRGNLSCDERESFRIVDEIQCEHHAQLLGSIILRSYSQVGAMPTCVNGSLTIDSDECGSFTSALNDLANKYLFDRTADVVRTCSSAPFSTASPREDADATYRFSFVQNTQYDLFLAGQFSQPSVVASLRLQLAQAANLPVSRFEVVAFSNDGVVDTVLRARTRAAESHTADLLVQLDAVISTPFLFDYSGRTLTTVIPGSDVNNNTPGASSDSDDSDDVMIIIIILLIVLVIVIAVVMYIRDAKKSKDLENPAKEEPVQMIAIDGKPYWRDDTLQKGKGTNIEETVIDDMVKPRRTTMEYNNPVAYRGAAAVGLPEGLAGFDYIIRNARPVMPFTFATAFPVAHLGNRTIAIQDREYAEIVRLSAAYRPNANKYKYIDDYNLPRGFVYCKDTLSWDIVWESGCTVLVIMPSLDEIGHVVPEAGESISTNDVVVLNNSTSMLTETVSCTNLMLTNELTGKERMVQALQVSKWDPADHSIEQDLIDILIAAKQSHFANNCSRAVVFDVQKNNRPTAGAFILTWICVKSALDSGFLDLARTSLLLRAQETLLVHQEFEYKLVHATLRKLLLAIPSMPDVQMTQAQKLAKVCLQSWHAAMKPKLTLDNGYLDVSATAPLSSSPSAHLAPMRNAPPVSFPDFPEPTGPTPTWRSHA